MRSRASLVLAAAVATFATVARADEQTDLDHVRASYLARDYDAAERRLLAMLDPQHGSVRDPALLAQARMYWGAVMLAKGNADAAAAAFEKLILEDPTYEPDPLSFPTSVIDLFIDTRAKLRERLNAEAQERVKREAERRAREEAEKRHAAERLAMLERMAGEEEITERHSRWIAMVPFGAGQFQNGQRALGWVFLASESALVLGTAVTLPIYLTDLEYRTDAHAQGDDVRAREYIDRANAVRTVNLVMAGAFAAVAVAGVAQAQIAFVPEQTETKKRAIPPVAGAGLKWEPPLVAPCAEGRGFVAGIGARF